MFFRQPHVDYCICTYTDTQTQQREREYKCLNKILCLYKIKQHTHVGDGAFCIAK